MTEINQVEEHIKSFETKVIAHDRDKLLDSNIWPIGLICKKSIIIEISKVNRYFQDSFIIHALNLLANLKFKVIYRLN